MSMANPQNWSKVVRWAPTRMRIGSIANAWEEAVLEPGGMSFGLSPGDIKLAWQVVSFLYEKCFTKAQGADVLYLKFGRELESFTETLQQLVTIIKHANGQRPRRPWGYPDDECRVALHPVSQAIGDFRKTIADCERLLNDNERFQRDSAGFVDNVVWHLSTQRDVEILRERIHFHKTKLLVIMKPFEMHLLLEIRQELRGLREDVIVIKGLLVDLMENGFTTSRPVPKVVFPRIPPEIVDKFLTAIEINAPETFRISRNIPTVEGFEALVYHFSKSTVGFDASLDASQKMPEEVQFVNLLKSKWLLDQIEGSQQLSYEGTGTGSLWTSALQDLKSDIIKEYRRFDNRQLTAPPRDGLSRLPEDCFSIWVVEAPEVLAPDLAEQRPFEDEILKLTLPDTLGTRETSLHVFKRSAVEHRLVTTKRDTSIPGYHQESDFIVNTDVTRLIPAYTTPTEGDKGHNLLLSSKHVQDLRWQKNIYWSINGSQSPGKCGDATLQMWQPQQLQTTSELDSPSTVAQPDLFATSTRSFSDSGFATGQHSRRDSRRSTTLSSPTSTFSGSSATSVMRGSRANGTAVHRPEPPVIVFFTLHDGKYAFLHLEFSEHIFVNPESCDCRRNSRRDCFTVVIETRGKVVDLRRSSASQASGKGLYTWDLARFRIPRHPEFKDVEVLVKVKYMTLKFETLAEKDEFLSELKQLEKVRDLENRTYRNILEEKAKVIRQSTSMKITRLRKPVLAFVKLIDESILDVLFRARKMLGVTPISVFGMSVALSKIMVVDVSFNAVALFLDGLIYIVQHP
ncbi:hypothetical protein G7Y79_00034g069210 [Physcia stellaris]|nr:hypothetical protein G7Y79_00034g069210 [Physcia stellaris]